VLVVLVAQQTLIQAQTVPTLLLVRLHQLVVALVAHLLRAPQTATLVVLVVAAPLLVQVVLAQQIKVMRVVLVMLVVRTMEAAEAAVLVLLAQTAQRLLVVTAVLV